MYKHKVNKRQSEWNENIHVYTHVCMFYTWIKVYLSF